MLLELVFALGLHVVIKTKMQELQPAPPYVYMSSNDPVRSKDYIQKILTRIETVHKSRSSEAVKDFLSGWCFDAPFSDIKRDNIAEFLSWCMFNLPPSAVSRTQGLEISDVISYLKERHGVEFSAGHNEEVRCVKLSLEPVEYLPRPLLCYVGVFFLEKLMQYTFCMMGFSMKTTKTGLSYWFRPSSTASPSSSDPLLFFHGIAPGGPLFYAPMLFSSGGILADSDRACYLFSNPAVTMCCHLIPPTEEETIAGVLEAVYHHTPDRKLVIAGHSLGSCSVTWLARAIPHLVSTVLLVDPVTLFLSHPAVAVNFVYK